MRFLDVNSYQALIYSVASSFILFSILKVRLKMASRILSRKKVSWEFIWRCTPKRRESTFLYWFQKYKTDGNTLSFLVCFMPLGNTTPHGTEFSGSLCVDKWSGCYFIIKHDLWLTLSLKGKLYATPSRARFNYGRRMGCYQKDLLLTTYLRGVWLANSCEITI